MSLKSKRLLEIAHTNSVAAQHVPCGMRKLALPGLVPAFPLPRILTALVSALCGKRFSCEQLLER